MKNTFIIILLAMLLLRNFAVFMTVKGQTVTPDPGMELSPTPEALPLPSPTPPDATSPESPTPEPSPYPTAAPEITLEATSSAAAVAEPAPEVMTPVADGLQISEDTGSTNTSTPPDSNSIITASASSSVTVTNELNTNAIGASPVIVNSNDDSAPDLSNTGNCTNSIPAADIDLNNNAQLQTTLDIEALTGANTSSGVNITTGDAVANADISSLVNTNLIGSCWNFTLLNLYNTQSGNVILPYELSFLNLNDTGSRPVAMTADTVNNATVSTSLQVSANTGLNNASEIYTGDATQTSNILDVINTNIYANNWLYLRVHAYEGWNGTFRNWWGNTLITPTDAYAWINLADSGMPMPAQSIRIENNALLNTRISAVSDTGNNSAGQGSVHTGNAGSTINVFNMVNTNIIGNNWYFAMINLFDTFNGDIVFARPDLTVTGTAPSSAHPGDNITQSVVVKNTGTFTAFNTRFEAVLPPELICSSASPQGSCTEGKSVWEAGDIAPGESKTMEMMLRVDTDIAKTSKLVTVVTGSTVTDEPVKENNMAVLTMYVEPFANTPGTTDTSVAVSDIAAGNQTPPAAAYGVPIYGGEKVPRVIFADYQPENPKGSVIGAASLPERPESSGKPLLLKILNWLIIVGIADYHKRRWAYNRLKKRILMISNG